MELIQDKLNLKKELKDTKVLLDKLYNLMFIQAKEIDLIHLKLFRLQGNLGKALEVLEISKNIEEPLKERLKKELELEILKEIEGTSNAKEQPDGLRLPTTQEEN